MQSFEAYCVVLLEPSSILSGGGGPVGRGTGPVRVKIVGAPRFLINDGRPVLKGTSVRSTS